MTLSIIIPNWNGKEKLARNLPKVLEVKGFDEVIVVDDASTDDSVKLLTENFKNKVKLIEKSRNSGFGSTVNLGVKNANSDLVFLLNTDAVPEKNCLEKVIPHFKKEKVFSIGLNSGGNWSWVKWEDGWFVHFMKPLRNGEKAKTHETLWASGGSGVFRKSIWDKLGGFDELMDPFYVEDLDLGYRAWKRGYINLWEADAHVEHYKEAGVIISNFPKSKIQNISERNMLIFIWKNIHGGQLISSHISHLILRIIKNPKFIIPLINTFIKLPYILRKRIVEAKKSRFFDKEVLGKY